MPTVLTISGLRVVIYLNDHRPAHVHIIGLYEHRLLIVHNRAIRTLIAAALTQFEAEMGAAIRTAVQQATRERWYALVAELVLMVRPGRAG